MIANVMSLFDLHCHLDLFPDPSAAFEECRASKLTTVAVTTTPRAWRQNCKWAEGNRYVLPALGLHPELVATHGAEIDLLLDLMKGVSIIGETGLDGSSRHRGSYEDQIRIFRRIVAVSAREPGRILSIHSRSAVKDVLEVLQPHAHAIKPILHWFSGSAVQAKSALALGCYFSVNGAMTATEGGKAVIAAIPIDRVLLETDAPFRKEAASATGRIKDLERTCEAVAKLKRVDNSELKERLLNTFTQLVGKNGNS